MDSNSDPFALADARHLTSIARIASSGSRLLKGLRSGTGSVWRATKDALPFELGDPIVRKTEVPRKNLAIVFTQKGRLQFERIRIGGKAQRKSWNLKIPEDAVVYRAHRPPLDQMRMLHRFLDRQHRRVRNSRFAQDCEYGVGTWDGRKPSIDRLVHFRAIRNA